MTWVLNQQTQSPNRPSLKYSSGGSGPLWKWNEAFCLPTNGGGGQYLIMENSNANHTTERTTAPGQADATNSMPNTQSGDESWGHGTTSLRYFSMFSGIGGFELGIERAALSVRDGQTSDSKSGSSEQSLESTAEGVFSNGYQPNDISPRITRSISCVGFSEIDKYAIKIYESHFGGHKNYGDATRIVPEELPDFDLLVGGFPCQAFSIAGKRLGFEDTRGTLFFDIARILKVKRPRMFLLENVKGLLSHDDGRTFKTIITTLAELGYCVEWQVLNSKNHGVPQNRERVFIVGHLGDFCGREVFPIGEGDGTVGSDIKRIAHNDIFRRYNQTYDPSGSIESLDTSGGGGHQPCVPVRCDKRTGDVYKVEEYGTLQSRDYKGFQNYQHNNGVLKDMRIRRLTPTECERLQGYPDGWTAGVSDSQRYKTLGNSVTVNVIEAIMRRLLSLGDGGKNA